MRNRSQKYEARTLPLLIVLLTFLLPGCRPATAQQEAQPASAEAVANGDADKGRALFMGYTHFHNAGPPCMGCHSVGQNGILGGGALGPNLTNVSTQREDAAIVGFLSGSGTETSPVMQPIYADHPLTEQEQADLRLVEVEKERVRHGVRAQHCIADDPHVREPRDDVRHECQGEHDRRDRDECVEH